MEKVCQLGLNTLSQNLHHGIKHIYQSINGAKDKVQELKNLMHFFPCDICNKHN